MAREHSGHTVDELTEQLLAALWRMARGSDSQAPSVGAAQVAQGLLRDLREADRRAEEREEREAAAKAAKRLRPEARTLRHQLLWSLRTYQEVAATETGIARIQAQKAADGILTTLAEMEEAEPERDLTPAERLLAITQAAPAMSDEEMEVVVREWLGRRKLVLEVSETGEVSLVRRAVRLVV